MFDSTHLTHHGYARIPALLTPAECAELRNLFDQDNLYRKTVDMARYRFGEGRYRYFASPLPALVDSLRRTWYAAFQPSANEWAAKLGKPLQYPATWEEFAAECAAAGAHLPTPLILRYGPGGYNTLHQDLYGGLVFPFQLVVLLSEADHDYSGGEFVLVEQRPRAQSRAHVLRLALGEGLVFATAELPVQGTRGMYRAALRHGISQVHTGERMALGVIFHQAVS